MKVVVRTLSVVLAVSVMIAAIAAGALYVDGRTVYQGPDLLAGSVRRAPAIGPLRVPPSDARYFVDTAGRPVYLTGSHTWNNLQDLGYTDPPDQFDFEEYLRFLELRNHNFIRMWRSESPRVSVPGRVMYVAPHPWLRTGPGAAADGKARFDLTKFDPAYFDRLRTRVRSAGERGFYVSVMLFEGWGMRFSIDGYNAHPFKATNNVNGIECDLNRDGKGLECFTLADAAVTRLQEAYVRQVVDTVNDLDNVLYEINNEGAPESKEWQLRMIQLIKGYESGKPKQHPVGMTEIGVESNNFLLTCPADWISPVTMDPLPGQDYVSDPPAATGAKVILSDTDHLSNNVQTQNRATHVWVWKSFLRGLNPIYMDQIPELNGPVCCGVSPYAEDVRQAMGATRRYSQKINLATMTPQNDLASTAYCLAHPGSEYLVYQPTSGPFTATLAKGKYSVEWFNPATGTTSVGESVNGEALRVGRGIVGVPPTCFKSPLAALPRFEPVQQARGAGQFGLRHGRRKLVAQGLVQRFKSGRGLRSFRRRRIQVIDVLVVGGGGDRVAHCFGTLGEQQICVYSSLTLVRPFWVKFDPVN